MNITNSYIDTTEKKCITLAKIEPLEGATLQSTASRMIKVLDDLLMFADLPDAVKQNSIIPIVTSTHKGIEVTAKAYRSTVTSIVEEYTEKCENLATEWMNQVVIFKLWMSANVEVPEIPVITNRKEALQLLGLSELQDYSDSSIQKSILCELESCSNKKLAKWQMFTKRMTQALEDARHILIKQKAPGLKQVKA
jgi:hypothetical protein